MRQQQFKHSPLPYLLIAPQLLIILVFFVWPAIQSINLSLYLEDPWGLGRDFVGLENYITALNDDFYYKSASFTAIFSTLVTFFSLAIALLLAVKADNILHGQTAYKVLLIWPYAVAPAVAGLMALFLFDSHIGPVYDVLHALFGFDHKVNPTDATIALTTVAVWKQVSVNFVYFLAGLQGIPKAVKEAAALDCRNGFKRFWSITFPLLAPTTFFLLVINITYAFFDTFSLIDTFTRGAPGGGTTSLVYKVYRDGFIGADLGGSSAQSVILMIFVMALTVIQFRFIERKIHY